MTNVKNNERYVPMKNYILAFVVVVVIIFLTWYGFAWYKVLSESRVSTSYLVKEKVISNEITNLDELSAVFSEAPHTYFIYVSYTGREDIYNMEKDLKSIINEYSLNDIVYYLNITSIKDDVNCIDKINESLNLDNVKITSVPTILYYNDGEVVDIITRSDNNIMNVGDFQKLLDINNVVKE